MVDLLMASMVVPKEVTAMEKTWQDVVNDRIASNTRRFASNSKKSVTEAKPNAFAAFAGDFFFPLIQRFDGKDIVFVIKDFDSILLSRMLFSLSIIDS